MASIQIKDLEMDEELDRKAMAGVVAGCFYPSPLGLPNPIGLFHAIRLKLTRGPNWSRGAYWLGLMSPQGLSKGQAPRPLRLTPEIRGRPFMTRIGHSYRGPATVFPSAPSLEPLGLEFSWLDALWSGQNAPRALGVLLQRHPPMET